jgi:hypothetical protein
LTETGFFSEQLFTVHFVWEKETFTAFPEATAGAEDRATGGRALEPPRLLISVACAKPEMANKGDPMAITERPATNRKEKDMKELRRLEIASHATRSIKISGRRTNY